SMSGNLSATLRMMDEDVTFLGTGHPPMRGGEVFSEAFESVIQKFRVESSAEIREIKVIGDWAYTWVYLTVTMTPLDGGTANRKTGDALSILRKQADGRWVIYRDANMLAPEKPGGDSQAVSE